MHMDDALSEMSPTPLTSSSERDLHTLCRVITEKGKQWADDYLSFFLGFFPPLNVFLTSREMHSSSVSTTINQHL